jgi:hypothetical protein
VGALLDSGSDSLGVLPPTVMVGIACSGSASLGCEEGDVSDSGWAVEGLAGSPPLPLMTAEAVETEPVSAALNVEKGGGLDVRLRQLLAVSLSTCRGFGEGERLLDPDPFLFTDKEGERFGVDPEEEGEGTLSAAGGFEERASRVEGPGPGPAEADSSVAVALLLASPAFFFFSSASLRCCSS